MGSDCQGWNGTLILSYLIVLAIKSQQTSKPAEVAYSIYDRLRHIHKAPLRNLRLSLWWIRKTFFTKPRTPTPSYAIDMQKPEIVRMFGRRHFEPGWELSYNYHGEILNLRRIVYVDNEKYQWWQVHVRGYTYKKGIELTAHYETEPAEHPDAHINLHGIDVSHGMSVVKDILESENIDYQRLEPEERPQIQTDDIETARR